MMATVSSSHLVFGYLIRPSRALQVAERIKDSNCELMAVDEQRSAYAFFSKDSHISVTVSEILDLERFPLYDTSVHENWSNQLAEVLQEDEYTAASWLLIPARD